jgi:hypothetical protein
MARILGEAGRYTSEEALKGHRRFALTGLLGIAFLGTILGIVLGRRLTFGRLTSVEAAVSEIILVISCIAVGKYVLVKLDKFERERHAMRRGADGEVKIARILGDLPDEFRIINGLSTPFGDLDHIVVGPTGVYIVDSKNWRGVVASDGQGELLLNGNPTDKPTIRPIVARMMSVREKVGTLCGFDPPFFKVLLAFPAARVEARWGTTGAATCLTDEQLHAHIMEERNANNMDERRIDSIARAFLALATMDKEFRR